MKEHANWIEGKPCPAARSFELLDPAVGGASLGKWSRAGHEELAQAMDVAVRASSKPADARRRAQAIRAAIRAVARDPDPDGLVARSLGLEPGELEPHAERLAERLLDRLERGLARPQGPEPGVVFVQRHWSELYGALEALVSELAAGRAVVMLSDPVAPGLAEGFARALADCGLERGAFALLHDDGETVLRAACGGGGFERISASGHPEGRARLEAYFAGARPTPGIARFGAGVIEVPPVDLAFTPLLTRAVSIAATDDPEERGREVALAAFGRTEALSGQLPGCVGRVTGHPRVFSRFTEALLAALEADGAAFAPLPLRCRDALRKLEEGLHLGLDEGATLVHELPPTASRPSRPNARVGRLVFTNVDPESRLAAPGRPVAILALVRG